MLLFIEENLLILRIYILKYLEAKLHDVYTLLSYGLDKYSHTYISCICLVSMDNAWQMVQQYVCEIHTSVYVCAHTDIYVCIFTIFSLPPTCTYDNIINNY